MKKRSDDCRFCQNFFQWLSMMTILPTIEKTFFGSTVQQQNLLRTASRPASNTSNTYAVCRKLLSKYSCFHDCSSTLVSQNKTGLCSSQSSESSESKKIFELKVKRETFLELNLLLGLVSQRLFERTFQNVSLHSAPPPVTAFGQK